MTIRELTTDDADALAGLFGGLSERDLTFIREDLGDRAKIETLSRTSGLRFVEVNGDDITGYAAVERLPGWSNHVGELRLVVDPDRRGAGVGRSLAQHALAAALQAGIGKVVVELAADQDGALAMFAGLGFTGEALLRDHIRDRDGQLRDLIVLAHHADENWSVIDAVGLADALHS
jgi:ribosomal protein S18 acetylase RimI-like enzyme